MKKKMIIKVISIVLVISLFWQGVVWTTPTDSPESMVHGPQMLDNIYIPGQYGRIEKLADSEWLTTNSKKVILIKDAHCHYEAQRNISNILNILVSDYKVDLVGIEGAYGRVDPSVIRYSPLEKIRKEISDKYLRRGWLSASEALAIEKGKECRFSIWGVEDMRLYLNNLRVFRDVFSENDVALRFVDIAGMLVCELKKRLYPQALLDFDTKITGYKVGTLGLTELIEYLYDINRKGFKNFINLSLIIKAVAIEKDVDFNKIEQERSRLIKRIEKNAPREQIQELVKKSLLFKLGKLSSIDYYTYLKGLMPLEICTNYHNLYKYTNTLKIHHKIDEDRLFIELDLLIEDVYRKHTRDKTVLGLYEIDKKISILKKLLRLEVSKDELLDSTQDKIDMREMTGFLKIQCGLHNITLPPEFSDNEFISQAEDLCKRPYDFYRYAMERDRAIVENLIQKMGEKDKDRAALLIGGFHASEIEKLLIQKGVRVVVITPSITKEDTEAKGIYLSRMMDKRIHPADILKTMGLENLAEPRISAVESPWRDIYKDTIDRIGNEMVRAVIKGSPTLQAAAEEFARSDLSGADIEFIINFMTQLPAETPGMEILASLVKEKSPDGYKGLLERIINSHEEDINKTIITIRKKENAGEDVSQLYEEVEKKIEDLQRLYREYEGFIRDTKTADDRNDFIVMIPTHNRTNDLARLLESLYREIMLFGYATNRRIHIVIVDDSTLDMESTYLQIISEFSKRFEDNGNVTIRYYSREEQRRIIKNLKDKGIDLGYFINKETEEENFGSKGYAGIRNMQRIITAVEAQKEFRDQDVLMLHVDDDIAFGNPLRKTARKIEKSAGMPGLDKITHIFNYFAAADRVFRENPDIGILGGGYTIQDGTMPTVEGKKCIYYGDKEVKIDDQKPRRGFILGGNYVVRRGFEEESIPFIPGKHRCEDIIMGGVTMAKRLNSLALAHYQSFDGREMGVEILNEFVGSVVMDFIIRLGFPLFSREDLPDTNGWDGLSEIIDKAETVELDTSLDDEIYGKLLVLAVKNIGEKYNFGISAYERFIRELISYSTEIFGFERIVNQALKNIQRTRDPPDITGVEPSLKKYLDKWGDKINEITLDNWKDIISDIDSYIQGLGEDLERIILVLRFLLKNICEDKSLDEGLRNRIIPVILKKLIGQKRRYIKKKALEAQEGFRQILFETRRQLDEWQEWNEWRAENKDTLVSLCEEQDKEPGLAIISGRDAMAREITKKTNWRIFYGPLLEEVVFRSFPFIAAQLLAFFISPLLGSITIFLGNIVSSLIFVSLHEKANRKTALLVGAIGTLLSTVLFPLGINFWTLIAVTTVMHSMVNLYILIKQRRGLLNLKTLVRKLDCRHSFAIVSGEEILQEISFTHEGRTVNMHVSQDLLKKKDVLERTFMKISSEHPAEYTRLEGISITLTDDTDYLIGLGENEFKIHRFLLDVEDDLLEDIIEYILETLLSGKGDKSALVKIVGKVLDGYEKGADADVMEIRKKEEKGEKVEHLYEEVMEKMRQTQGLYRLYEKFIKEEGIEDKRDDFMIIIPTMDRVGDLKRLLESLYEELELFGYATNRRIHVVIVDDSEIDLETTYETIIDRFKKKSKDLGNVTIGYYTRKEQRNLMEGLKERGYDLGFFVNAEQAEKTGFGHKGYAGIRNMLKIISSVEQEKHFDDDRPPLVLHVDDDMRFSNPLRKPKKSGRVSNEDLDEQHILNYFARVSRIFRDFNEIEGRHLPVLSGSYTGRGGHISNAIRGIPSFYNPSHREMKMQGALLGGHYICNAEFDIDSIPMVPVGIRGEDMLLAYLTGARDLGSLSISHHQSLIRNVDKDLMNDFEGNAFLYLILPFLPNKFRESNGWDIWDGIITSLRKEDPTEERLREKLERGYKEQFLEIIEEYGQYFNIEGVVDSFVKELVSYYNETQILGLWQKQDEEREDKLGKYLAEWPFEMFGRELNTVKLKMLKEFREDMDIEILLKMLLEEEENHQERIYILRALLKNIFNDNEMRRGVKERVLIKTLELIIKEKDLYIKDRIIEKQKGFLEKLDDMTRHLQTWRSWLKDLRERESKPDNIGKDVDFEVITDSRIKIIMKNGEEIILKTEETHLDNSKIEEIARSLNAHKILGEEFISSLSGITIKVFDGTSESRAQGAFAHMEEGIIYIDKILLNSEVGGMTVIHEALHAFLLYKYSYEELKEMIEQIENKDIKDRIYRKAEPYIGEQNRYLAYLRHYYSRYYLQNSLNGGYSGSINERLTYHIRLRAVSDKLGIEAGELRRIFSGKGVEYSNRLLNILKRDGKVTKEELQVIVESAETASSILEMIKDGLPLEIMQRIEDIRIALGIYVAIKRLEESEKAEQIPDFIKDLIKRLEASAERCGIDPNMAGRIVTELYEADGYSMVEDRLVINPYYSLMLEGIINMFGIEEGQGFFDALDKYQRAKTLAKKGLNIATTQDAVTAEEIYDIVIAQMKGKTQSLDRIEKLAGIIAMYKVDKNNILGLFKEGSKMRCLAERGLETVLARIGLKDGISGYTQRTDHGKKIDTIRIVIKTVLERIKGVKGLCYIDRYNAGTAILNGSGMVDRLESGGKLDLEDWKKFMEEISREYMLLDPGDSTRLLTALTALYGYRLLERLLDEDVHGMQETAWPDNVPLVIEARLLVGDVTENPDGTYRIAPLGEPCVWLIRKAIEQGHLKILYNQELKGLDGVKELEREAVKAWLLEHGINVGDGTFTTEYPHSLIEGADFAISMLSDATTEKLGKLSNKHRIIKGKQGECDLLLMSRMAAILGSHYDMSADKDSIENELRYLYGAYYRGVLDKVKIDEYVANVVNAIQSGQALIIDLPPMVPFVSPFYNTLKQASETVGSAA